MIKKILSILMASVLVLSSTITTLAAETEALHEHQSDGRTECHCDAEIECSCDDCETACYCEGETAYSEDSETENISDGDCGTVCCSDDCVTVCICDDSETMCQCDCETTSGYDNRDTEDEHKIETERQTDKESSGYFLLETRSGASIVVFGTPMDVSKPTHRLAGSRPCALNSCKNVVTVKSKYDYACDTHKCSVNGCSHIIYQINPNKCQFHAGVSPIICQIYVEGNPKNMCGKAVINGSLCCWDHHCPGCLGPSTSNASLCYYCQQCWVPGCANISTCTNECNTHCPHTCKTHHKTHCLTCHNDPCICYPVDPTIKVQEWNSTDNSVTVDISSARAVEIELYTSDGTKFATLTGASGKHIFRYNAKQNNGSYYVRVKSKVGYNSGKFTFKISTLDVAAPNITGKSSQPANDIWATSKTLKITATDQTNALYSLRYEDGTPVPNCLDKEGIASGSVFEASWTITEQLTSAKTFRIIATDRWGYSSETTVSISRIDNKKPSKPTVSIDGGGWRNTDVTVSIFGGNADSGIDHYKYRVNGSAWQMGSTVIVNAEGIHKVEAKAVSGSGLESDIESATVMIDKTKPAASYTLSPEGWTTESVTITLLPKDEGGSGLASVRLPNGETLYNDFSHIQFPVSYNGDYSFTVTDSAGNSSVIVVPVGNIAMLDVTVTLSAPFVISPDDDRLYASGISFRNNSNVPISMTLERMTPLGNAPRLVGRNEKAWKSLSVSDTRKYIALGFAGNGLDFWIDPQRKDQPYPLGTIAKGSAASYIMQGKYGYAWEQAEAFTYGMAVKVSIAA